MEFIDLKSQYRKLKTSIDERMQRVLDHGQYIMGPEIEELERELAKFTGSHHCVTCSSGTDALLISLMALQIVPGDEVITTPFSFMATGEVIAFLGAKPVFVDIDPHSYNVASSKIEEAITVRTRIIMPVSMFGLVAEMDEINAIAARHGLAVVEDGAQSFGATYKGKHSCALSTIGCTSFFPSKPLGCYGDGGACFTDDKELAKRMREIRVHGQDRRYHHHLLGVNARMDTLQAAVLLAKLEVLPEEILARVRIASHYNRRLAESVQVPFTPSSHTSVFAQYTIEVDHREEVQKRLQLEGIPTSVHYPTPLHLQPVFSELNLGRGSFPVSETAAERVLSLPMHPYLEDEDIQRISTKVSESVLAVH